VLVIFPPRCSISCSCERGRRDAYLQFIGAAGTCHTRLREIAQDPGAVANLEEATRAALTDAAVYDARERLYIEASPAVAGKGQAMFEWLRELRRAERSLRAGGLRRVASAATRCLSLPG